MFTHNPSTDPDERHYRIGALALGNDAHATRGIGMTDRRQWQPTVEEAPHTIPEDAAVLTAPRRRAIHYTSPVLTGAQGAKRCVP
jgi:hypothetical protein